jgi:hypothetical protein
MTKAKKPSAAGKALIAEKTSPLKGRKIAPKRSTDDRYTDGEIVPTRRVGAASSVTPEPHVHVLQPGRVMMDLSETDLNKLADKIASRTKCNDAPAETERVVSDKKVAPVTMTQHNMEVVKAAMNRLSESLRNHQSAIEPILMQERDSEEGATEAEHPVSGNSEISMFLRETFNNLSRLTVFVEEMTSRVEA